MINDQALIVVNDDSLVVSRIIRNCETNRKLKHRVETGLAQEPFGDVKLEVKPWKEFTSKRKVGNGVPF